MLIEISEDEARTVSRMLFKARNELIESFAKADPDFVARVCATFGTTFEDEITNGEAVEARIDAALVAAGERAANVPVVMQ